MAPLAVLLLLAISPPAVATAPPLLDLGSEGPRVRAVQTTLARTRFLARGDVTGKYGWETWHAVVAFQGFNDLPRDGVVGPRTRKALSRARRPRPWSKKAGFEVHIAEQVLLLVRDRRVRRAIHVSTGAGGRTPEGHYRVYRRERMSWSVPFQTWMPFAQYFTGGFAMHEYPSVPAYPASHGCVRLPAHEAERVWNFGRVGLRVWTSRETTDARSAGVLDDDRRGRPCGTSAVGDPRRTSASRATDRPRRGGAGRAQAPARTPAER